MEHIKSTSYLLKIELKKFRSDLQNKRKNFMKKIVITGATSFIGRHLVKQLELEGYNIICIVRNGKNIAHHSSKKIRTISLDMHQYEKLSELIDEPCDIFISLAWNGTRNSSRMDEKLQQLNYQYSLIALEQAVQLGCTTILSAGSQAEYGPMTHLVTENTPCYPNTEYGKWKYRFYQDAQRYCIEKKVNFIEPRFFSLYGEDDNYCTLVLSILNKMLRNEECYLTKCLQLWDFLYIDDAINGIISLLNAKSVNGVYNFGYGEIRPLKEFVLKMYDVSKSQSKLLFGSIPYPETGMVNVCPDITKLKKETGWRPRISFEEGISKIIEFIKK